MKQPTEEQILEASGKCPEAREVLATLYPDVFGIVTLDSWVEIDYSKLEAKTDTNNGGVFVTLHYKGEEVACMDYFAQYTDSNRRNIMVKLNNSYAEKFKIVPDNLEDGYGNFRIYERSNI